MSTHFGSQRWQNDSKTRDEDARARRAREAYQRVLEAAKNGDQEALRRVMRDFSSEVWGNYASTLYRVVESENVLGLRVVVDNYRGWGMLPATEDLPLLKVRDY